MPILSIVNKVKNEKYFPRFILFAP